MRTDTALIKHLSDTISPEAAQAYNRLPLFIMPEESDELIQHEDTLMDAAPEILALPFDDFLLDFPFGTVAIQKSIPMFSGNRGRMWVRVRRFDQLNQDDPATTVQWDQQRYLKDLADGIFLEAWEEKTAWGGGLPPYPDYSAVNITRECIGDFTAYWHLYPHANCPAEKRMMGTSLGWCNLKKCTNPAQALQCSSSEMIQATMCRLVILSLIYISEGLGGMTARISWRPTPGSKEEKSERLKPWTAPRRQTYIMIDPARAGEYGHPSGVRPDAPGHHSSPHPHARRGHWRRLNPDRKTWVRQSWIGATEWSHEGRAYKIKL